MVPPGKGGGRRAIIETMRYARAVEKIRILAEACEDVTKRLPVEEPFVREAYVFGDVLRGADPLEAAEGPRAQQGRVRVFLAIPS
jgi:hypothetical protein